MLPGGGRLLGHALEFGRDPLALLQRAREHGDVVRLRFGPFHLYVLNSPDAIRQALVGQARKLEKGLSFGRAKRLIGNGLVMSEGEDHRRQRRLMQPAFHSRGSPATRHHVRCRGAAHQRMADGGTLAFDRDAVTLTVLTRTLLQADIGSEAVDVERLLRVLLAHGPGAPTNVPGAADPRFARTAVPIGSVDGQHGRACRPLRRRRATTAGCTIVSPRRAPAPRCRAPTATSLAISGLRDDRLHHRLDRLPAQPGTRSCPGGPRGSRVGGHCPGQQQVVSPSLDRTRGAPRPDPSILRLPHETEPNCRASFFPRAAS